ncbi:MAG TPA: pyridoxal-phosphate dependent enzyme [Terriglobia bacterium]|nr:pyridoxal-phosphate dependent enzyme [Terriglobia bacterium]
MKTKDNRREALEAQICKTTIIESRRLSSALGARVVLASEAFQHTGSFKFRAAYNVVMRAEADLFLTASSGNFGQALAYACQLLGKSCVVMMPSTSAQVKVDAVRGFGGKVELIDVTVKSRWDRVWELAKEHPEAYVASPYDDPFVIEGNSSLGRELAALEYDFDSVVVPVGGGGLASGVVVGLRGANNPVPVIGAEPLLANDAARSLREGRIVSNESEPQTIADGARTLCLGDRNWEILKTGLQKIVEVPEGKIAEGLRVLFSLANLKVEPTGALAIGAMLSDPETFAGQTVCCVVSGGNVDPQVYSRLLLE